jgi:hypothetical protein
MFHLRPTRVGGCVSKATCPVIRLARAPAATSRACIHSTIQEAGLALSEQTGLTWALSRDWCYQMSNRFAWAWKLVELGKPVILIYLGFLAYDEP